MSLPAARITDPSMHGGLISTGFPTVLIGNMPAARITDMHTCPLVTVAVPHVGGPLIMGAFTVLTGNFPQSRQTDMMGCVGPPDAVMMGMPTVLVGMVGGGGLGGLLAGIGMAVGSLLGGPNYPRSVVDKNGNVVTEYNEFIKIEGSPEYQATVIQDLNTFTATKTGQAWEKAYAKEAKDGHKITIKPPSSDFNNGGATPADNNGLIGADNKTPGTGTSTTIEYNPARKGRYRGEDGNLHDRGPTDTLGHELIHGLHGAQGTDRFDHKEPPPYSNKEETSTLGVKEFKDDPITERKLLEETGRSARPDHDSIEESTYKDSDGKWYKQNGSNPPTEIPPPTDIGWRPNN